MKIWDNFKTWIIKKTFEDNPLFKWANGHKTEISRFLQLLAGVAVVVGRIWPEYMFVSEIDAIIAFVASTLGVEIGRVHKEVKAKSEE